MEIEIIKSKAKSIRALEGSIESAEKNKKSYDRVFAGKEIMVKDSESDTLPVFIMGKEKDLFLALLYKKQNDIIQLKKEALILIENTEETK